MTLLLDFDTPGAPLTMTCDIPGCTTVQTFTEPDYPAQRAAATKAGWLERQTSAGRLFLCPECAA